MKNGYPHPFLPSRGGTKVPPWDGKKRPPTNPYGSIVPPWDDHFAILQIPMIFKKALKLPQITSQGCFSELLCFYSMSIADGCTAVVHAVEVNYCPIELYASTHLSICIVGENCEKLDEEE